MGMIVCGAFAQEKKEKQDSLRTLELLRETLNGILESQNDPDQNILQLEIDGLIVDQTITKVGKDFYDIFYTKWEAPKVAKNFTIVIKEMPLPGIGTQVSILINDDEVFKQRIQPRYDIIEAMADYAIARASRFLTNYEAMKAQLGGEDQQGTGIF
ncbi:MAG: CsgE family curli-type amyloid fiber assembly protein [Marinifilaceae bacterium]